MAKETTNPRISQRTEVFAMRFDPPIKYMAELAARRERRSLTNFVEWAIEQALRQIVLRRVSGSRQDISAADAIDLLWDIDEAERLRKLQQHCPDLLSYDEQRVLGTIADFVMPGKKSPAFSAGDSVNWLLVKACWSELKMYALDKGSEKDLASAINDHAGPAKKDSK